MNLFTAIFFTIGQLLNILNVPTEFFDGSDMFRKTYGTVIEQTYEGYEAEDDVYIVLVDGELFHIVADDLQVGDSITTWTLFGQPTRTVYGER